MKNQAVKAMAELEKYRRARETTTKMWLKGNSAYMETRLIGDEYHITLFGEHLCSVKGEDNAKIVGEVISDALKIAGVIA